MPKFERRNIDRHRHGGQAGILPGPVLPTGFAQYPTANRHDQSAFFGHRNELIRRDGPMLRILPADQRFRAGNGARRQIEFRLIKKMKFTLRQSTLQPPFDKQPFACAGIHVGPEKLVIVAAIHLGVIHRDIGAFHHGIHITAIIGINADTNAQGNVKLMVLDLVRQGKCCNQFLGDMGGILRLFNFRQQDHEFVTALPADRVRCADAIHQTISNRAQQLIADLVPQRIVDMFEVIEIQKKQGQLLAVPSSQSDRLGQALREQDTIRQPSQKVMLCQIGHLLRHRLRCAGIVKNNHRTGHFAIPIVNRGC